MENKELLKEIHEKNSETYRLVWWIWLFMCILAPIIGAIQFMVFLNEHAHWF